MPANQNIDFKAALSFLGKYAKHEYRKPGTEGYTDDQTRVFADILEKGRYAINQFKLMVKTLTEKYGLVLSGQIRWDDSSHVKVREYIWASLVLPEASDGPESISIFASVNGGVPRFRFSLEIRNNLASKFPNSMANHHLFLSEDLPHDSKLVYVIGSDESGAPTVTNEPRASILNKVNNGTYKKVQLCQIVNDSDSISNADYYESMIEAVGSLLPFYKKVVAANGTAPIHETEEDPIAPEQEEAEEQEEFVMNYPKNLIFYGAPGTGKTYHTVNQAVAIYQKKSLEEIGQMDRDELTKIYRDLVGKGFITFITFHQSYSYEDFIMGIVPRLANTQTVDDNDEGKNLQYVRKDGIFYSICETAKLDQDHNYVLIIDEINRGNISKIFGELITLIEPSKRAGETEATTVRLPGLDSENLINFSVPSNVYIIGTMNTADRSIQHVDTALRRRFVFKEMVPETSLFKDVNIEVGTDKPNIKELLDKINVRIKRYFDREHVIGHAPFMDLRKPQLTDNQRLKLLGNIFAEQIIPLLQDYFFEDYAKIQRVLNEEADDILESIKLIRKAPEGLYDDDDGGHEVYEVAPDGDPAYYDIKTYLQMVK